MSWNPALEPTCPTTPEQCDAIETVIIPRSRDIGAFEVRRALPVAHRRMVGPFVFFDQMGPAEFLTDQGMDVRPHPHIGLATVTYLYKGGVYHRDSLGTSMEIQPGAVNWMIAGKGITHSERTAPERRVAGEELFGIQTWVALPEKDEDSDPGFEHVPETELPVIKGEGKEVRLILGSLFGEKAPVKTFSEMFYADVLLEEGAKIPLTTEHEDRGIYITSGTIEVNGETYEAGQMMVFRPGDEITVTAKAATRLMFLGGATLEGPRHLWWNFVSSSKEKLEQAKQDWAKGDWAHGRFQLPPEDHDEFIPLPEGGA